MKLEWKFNQMKRLKIKFNNRKLNSKKKIEIKIINLKQLNQCN